MSKLTKEQQNLMNYLKPKSRKFLLGYIETLMSLENVLETPPTAEQLCEELSKHMNEPVWLDERNEIRISTQWLVRKIYYEGEYKGLSFLVVLPPTLIKHIAQFYENEVK